jgi:hypothetical protein
MRVDGAAVHSEARHPAAVARGASSTGQAKRCDVCDALVTLVKARIGPCLLLLR